MAKGASDISGALFLLSAISYQLSAISSWLKYDILKIKKYEKNYLNLFDVNSAF